MGLNISVETIQENVGPFLGKVVAWCSSHLIATIAICAGIFIIVMGASLLFDIKEGHIRSCLLAFFFFVVLAIVIFFLLVALSKGIIKLPF